jgi:hypothetical protein
LARYQEGKLICRSSIAVIAFADIAFAATVFAVIAFAATVFADIAFAATASKPKRSEHFCIAFRAACKPRSERLVKSRPNRIVFA